MKKVVIINNLFVLIDFLPNESEEMFYDRVNFIINKYKKDNSDLDKIISLSKIYSNIKYKKCKYNSEITVLTNYQNL